MRRLQITEQDKIIYKHTKRQQQWLKSMPLAYFGASKGKCPHSVFCFPGRKALTACLGAHRFQLTAANTMVAEGWPQTFRTRRVIKAYHSTTTFSVQTICCHKWPLSLFWEFLSYKTHDRQTKPSFSSIFWIRTGNRWQVPTNLIYEWLPENSGSEATCTFFEYFQLEKAAERRHFL